LGHFGNSQNLIYHNRKYSMKRIFIIIVVIIIFIAVGFGVYFGWKKSKEILTPPMAEQGSPQGAASQTPEHQRLKILSDQPVFNYFIRQGIGGLATSSEIFYVNSSGQILKVSGGEDEIISDRIVENFQGIEADKSGDRIIVKYGLQSAPQFEIFDLGKKIWQPLSGISAATFLPDGTKIAYLENIKNSSVSNLITKSLTGVKPVIAKILSINQKDFDLKWLTSNKILLVSKPSSQIVGEIWEIDINKKTMRLFADGYGLMINWAKDNSLGLKFSVTQKGESELNLIDSAGVAKASLGFSTLPDKCLIGLAKIYCAIPQNYNAVKAPLLPDDYLKKAVYFEDKIYEIDIKANSFLEIPIGAETVIDAVNLSLAGNAVIFMNRYDNKLYKLDL